MRTLRTSSGPFGERPFFKPGLIDEICADELEKEQLYPPQPGPVRIERFIEKRFGASPVYEPLPAGVLGFTRFGIKGVEAVVVSSALIEDETVSSQRRVNSTLAHEAGHGLLHAHLFALAAAGQIETLFEGQLEGSTPRILCRDEGAAPQGRLPQRRRYDGRWWELQANQAIGGLLLPVGLVRECLHPWLKPSGAFGERALPAEAREGAVRLVSEIFDVNSAVARIRLDGMFPVESEGQLTF